jgi:uncharacterized protein YndB with AHSA1/START domain
MNPKTPVSHSEELAATLVVRRIIRATPERLFAAWTEPKHLLQWWGPEGVDCPVAEVDLRVGGAYRIANRFPGGVLVWIVGIFEVVEPPHRLTYTWRLESQSTADERVTVRFEQHGSSTEVIVTHERIVSAASRASHEHGWTGCLDSLVEYAERL